MKEDQTSKSYEEGAGPRERAGFHGLSFPGQLLL